jgi:radical SAM superfamily enzyme YgiQ (UPF0313 family)
MHHRNGFNFRVYNVNARNFRLPVGFLNGAATFSSPMALITPMTGRLLFVEPPKDYWFLMGEYLPPPTGLLALAAYVERELPEINITVLDCQAERRSWKGMADFIEDLRPDVVAASGFTCNAYGCARVAEEAKRVDAQILTVLGGQHFTALAEESLREFPEIDLIVRGEGELTLVDIMKRLRKTQSSAIVDPEPGLPALPRLSPGGG